VASQPLVIQEFYAYFDTSRDNVDFAVYVTNSSGTPVTGATIQAVVNTYECNGWCGWRDSWEGTLQELGGGLYYVCNAGKPLYGDFGMASVSASHPNYLPVSEFAFTTPGNLSGCPLN
jgi:hypothetical protein